MAGDAHHRVPHACVEAAEALEGVIVGEMPMGVVRMPLPKFAAHCPTRDMTRHHRGYGPLRGESVGAVTGVQSAAEVVQEPAEGAEGLLRVWA